MTYDNVIVLWSKFLQRREKYEKELALSVALSLSALSVVCATDRDVVMSAEITPELR